MRKNYKLISIGKQKAKKDELFEEIEKIDNNIKEEVRNIVKSGTLGEVLAVVKDKKIKGIYLFKIENNENKTILKHIKTVYTDEISKDVRDNFDKNILELLKESVAIQEYDKIIVGKKIIQIDHKTSKQQYFMAMLGGFLIGSVLGWLIFDNILVGLLWGVLFAPIFSGLDVEIVNKKKTKNKKEEKGK